MNWRRAFLWAAFGALVVFLGFYIWGNVACADAEKRMTSDVEYVVESEEHVYDETVDTGESPTDSIEQLDMGYMSEDDDDDW